MQKIGIQSKGIINENNKENGYIILKESGIICIDYNITWSDLAIIEDLSVYTEHRQLADKHGLEFSQVHAPRFSNMKFPNDLKTVLMQYENSLKVCKILGSPFLVVHPIQVTYPLNYEETIDLNRLYFLELGKLSVKYGVMICIENLINRFNNRIIEGICSTATDVVKMIQYVNSELSTEALGACLDVGHANALRKNLYSEILILGKHLKVLHIHDNNGADDDHQLPYSFSSTNNGLSTTDWNSFMLGLRHIGFKGVLSFEPYKSLITVPNILKPALLKYIYSIGKYFSHIIDFKSALEKYRDKQIILFGAGKMFDEYMNEFGKEFEPIFAVDNNNTLWGDLKNNIIIKNPQEILSIAPEDRCVIICNRYYEEIEIQLKSMNVTEYIMCEEVERLCVIH